MPRVGSSPARLVIALSVAAVLAVFVVYTAVAGNGIADVTPSTLAGHTDDVALVGKVVGKPHASTNGVLRFRIRDIGKATAARVPVVYRGSVPDLFKTGSDIAVNGTLRHGVFVAKHDSLVTKCPDHYAGKSSKT
jgi:cytochrome c-type biogenesis protein CcmE